MKTKCPAPLVAFVLIAPLSTGTLFGQTFAERTKLAEAGIEKAKAKLTRFDLDFPGGTPRDLVNAIQDATKRPLNVIMKEEDATAKLPALKLKNVTVVDLFGALRNIGRSTEKVQLGVDPVTGLPISSERQTSFQFMSRDGETDDDSIWTFVSEVRIVSPSASEPKSIRYYNLGPYLDTFKIDDITTAVKTGWEMLGEPSGAKFSFHKDTKLLIAVGRPDQLVVIDSVLKELAPTAQKRADAPTDLKAKRLAELKQRLNTLQQTLAPTHPEVARMRSEIATVEQELGIPPSESTVRPRIYIVGQVRIQGPIEIPAGERFTVGKAILRAGGFGEFANKKRVKLVRTLPDGTKKEEVLDMEQILEQGQTEKDATLLNDDFIVVPEKIKNL
jgi:hypothetical protein